MCRPTFQCCTLVEIRILCIMHYVIVRPLSTVGYMSVVAGVIHSRQWSN